MHVQLIGISPTYHLFSQMYVIDYEITLIIAPKFLTHLLKYIQKLFVLLICNFRPFNTVLLFVMWRHVAFNNCQGALCLT